MSGPTIVAFVGLLVAILLFIVAAMAWQEARSRVSSEGPVYVIDDAVDHVVTGLKERGIDRLRRSDVLRILEYEIFYLQGLAQSDRRNPVETVAGGVPASISYILEQIADRHGAVYAREDVEVVLALEASYLAGIGAVGETAEGNEERPR